VKVGCRPYEHGKGPHPAREVGVLKRHSAVRVKMSSVLLPAKKISIEGVSA
jgi:hypothetical protein